MGGGQVITSLDSNHPLRVTVQKGDTRQLSHVHQPLPRGAGAEPSHSPAALANVIREDTLHEEGTLQRGAAGVESMGRGGGVGGGEGGG